jgi:hypothetical protein
MSQTNLKYKFQIIYPLLRQQLSSYFLFCENKFKIHKLDLIQLTRDYIITFKKRQFFRMVSFLSAYIGQHNFSKV